MRPGRIAENVLIDDIDLAVSRYREAHGRTPLNVSHWDPSPEFSERLRRLLPLSASIDPIPYRYSYMLDQRMRVGEKLGFDSSSVCTLVTENGSASILAAANWLSAMGVERVRLAMPAYFTTMYCLQRFGLDVTPLPLQRESGRYHWPDQLALSNNEALWITNPVYNTGCYSLEAYADALACIIENGTVAVVDEALARYPSVFGKRCEGLQGFLGIYTPHKAVCLNGFKFSALIYHPDFDGFFDDWADILSGGLSSSSARALDHFISSDFDHYKAAFDALIAEASEWHVTALARYGGAIDMDLDAEGHFRSVYFPDVPSSLGGSIDFICDVIEATGTAFIPGLRSGFGSELGFCFRINLALDSKHFRGAIHRLYRHLAR